MEKYVRRNPQGECEAFQWNGEGKEDLPKWFTDTHEIDIVFSNNKFNFSNPKVMIYRTKHNWVNTVTEGEYIVYDDLGIGIVRGSSYNKSVFESIFKLK